MAYFPNGTSFTGWQERTCNGCLNDRDNGSGSVGCAIKDALFLHGYEHNECAISDYIIPEEGDDAWKCRMKLTAFDLRHDKLIDQRSADRARYHLAMSETAEIARLSQTDGGRDG